MIQRNLFTKQKQTHGLMLIKGEGLGKGTDWAFGFFHVLAIVNSAAMNNWGACILLNHVFL